MKKIISMVLAVINLFAFSAFASAPQISDAQRVDLYNLGIMVGDAAGDLRLEDAVTRAEATKMICVAGNVDISADKANTASFFDVSPAHWGYKYIAAAREHGIIDGDDAGNFKPDAGVTNEEIVKMIVCLLGYEQRAAERGGYPAGYAALADELGITKDMQLDVNVPAVRNDVAVMIYNALDVPLMKQKKEDNEDANGAIVYEIMDGTNGQPRETLRGTR